MIPSPRLYLLLLLGIPLASLLSIFFGNQISIITILVADLLLLGLGFWDAQQVKVHRVSVKRHPINKLSLGRDNTIVLSVASGNQPATITIKDYYPLQLPAKTGTISATIPANTTKELTYTIFPQQRGEFSWGNIQVRQLGNWGLAGYDWQISAPETGKVYPDLVALRSLSIRLALENSGTMRQAQRWGIGTEFTELREYALGDDPRLMDWKATARRSRPLVRVLEPEKEQTLIILLDRGRLMTAQVQGMKRFDWGLNATLSLALAGLSRGDRVGVGIFDKEVTTWIPPERGQHNLGKLIERLTPIQPVLLESDYFGAVTKLVTQQTRRALVVLITDLVDRTASTELLSAMTRLTPRYLPFCVALRDPNVDQLAHHQDTEINLETAYRRSVALDLLSQRQVVFARLQKQGVLVLDAPVNQISDKLVERYLCLKAKNLL